MLNGTVGQGRDTQRSRLYAAEKAVWPFDPTPSLSLQDIEAEVSRVLCSSWWRARWPEVTRVAIEDGRGRRRAGGHRDPTLSGQSWIALPRHFRHQWCVCHELSHVATPNRFVGHGREFAANYLDILRFTLGPSTAASLRRQFREHRVKHRAPVRTLQDLAARHSRLLEAGENLLLSTSGCSTVGT
jgi:putative metallohydrolase (TIGR04338 family)